jgi:hypothetical protein
MAVQHTESRDRDSAATEADARVAAWKLAWLEGAKAAWATDRRITNPYTDGLQRSAWAAGWNWAGQNPDRRAKQPQRLAHPHRRSTDSHLPRTLKRAAAVGATGVTLFAISRAVRWLLAPRLAKRPSPATSNHPHRDR